MKISKTHTDMPPRTRRLSRAARAQRHIFRVGAIWSLVIGLLVGSLVPLGSTGQSFFSAQLLASDVMTAERSIDLTKKYFGVLNRLDEDALRTDVSAIAAEPDSSEKLKKLQELYDAFQYKIDRAHANIADPDGVSKGHSQRKIDNEYKPALAIIDPELQKIKKALEQKRSDQSGTAAEKKKSDQSGTAAQPAAGGTALGERIIPDGDPTKVEIMAVAQCALRKKDSMSANCQDLIDIAHPREPLEPEPVIHSAAPTHRSAEDSSMAAYNNGASADPIDSGEEAQCAQQPTDAEVIAAVREKDIELVRCLIESGGNANAISDDEHGKPALTISILNESVDIAFFLLENGADYNKGLVSTPGAVPILYAAAKGMPTVVQELIEVYEVDIEFANEVGMRPLHIASLMGHIDVVQLLVGAGANTSALNKKKQTALDLAIEGKHDEVANFLRKNSAHNGVVVTSPTPRAAEGASMAELNKKIPLKPQHRGQKFVIQERELFGIVNTTCSGNCGSRGEPSEVTPSDYPAGFTSNGEYGTIDLSETRPQ